MFLNIVKIVLCLVVGGLFALAVAQTNRAADEVDPILEYYWTKAGRAAVQSDPAVVGVSYALTARSMKYGTTSSGDVMRMDSVLTRMFFTGGTLDSQQVSYQERHRLTAADLAWPNLFDGPYHYHMFPNDTGGGDLALGLVADSGDVDSPDALVYIDRQFGYPRWMYLTYPQKPGYRRFTRGLRFAFVDGLVFPDSVWEMGATQGLLSREQYRIETSISDIQILR
ncbi:MAG: hypothetical protein KKA42_15955 [candidate division Zixibacteria bacterium]|nr:hypothetical protein [candidate division Zixibacteria bacterium]